MRASNSVLLRTVQQMWISGILLVKNVFFSRVHATAIFPNSYTILRSFMKKFFFRYKNAVRSVWRCDSREVGNREGFQTILSLFSEESSSRKKRSIVGNKVSSFFPIFAQEKIIFSFTLTVICHFPRRLTAVCPFIFPGRQNFLDLDLRVCVRFDHRACTRRHFPYIQCTGGNGRGGDMPPTESQVNRQGQDGSTSNRQRADSSPIQKELFWCLENTPRSPTISERARKIAPRRRLKIPEENI